MTDILILNGPNLNLLGSREPGHYGTDTLADIDRRLTEAAREAGVTIESRQSNHEGELVDLIQQAPAAGGALHDHQPGGLQPYQHRHARRPRRGRHSPSSRSTCRTSTRGSLFAAIPTSPPLPRA
ncbi:MAG: type II 3-dehydroquinate dehydratase [Gammaproteobacteria bacterium]|nr:type II 3-dehydroquinate dehydratase [Gammaproteobacteria bacterium]